MLNLPEVLEPTRRNYILDLFITNNLSEVTRRSVIQGISDHDVQTNVSPKYRGKYIFTRRSTGMVSGEIFLN